MPGAISQGSMIEPDCMSNVIGMIPATDLIGLGDIGKLTVTIIEEALLSRSDLCSLIAEGSEGSGSESSGDSALPTGSLLAASINVRAAFTALSLLDSFAETIGFLYRISSSLFEL